jgi:Glutamate-cysteine ligase
MSDTYFSGLKLPSLRYNNSTFPSPDLPSSPLGRLANVDCRWNAIAQSVDDRTPTEREDVPAGETPEDGTQRPYMAGGGVY